MRKSRHVRHSVAETLGREAQRLERRTSPKGWTRCTCSFASDSAKAYSFYQDGTTTGRKSAPKAKVFARQLSVGKAVFLSFLRKMSAGPPRCLLGLDSSLSSGATSRTIGPERIVGFGIAQLPARARARGEAPHEGGARDRARDSVQSSTPPPTPGSSTSMSPASSSPRSDVGGDYYDFALDGQQEVHCDSGGRLRERHSGGALRHEAPGALRASRQEHASGRRTCWSRSTTSSPSASRGTTSSPRSSAWSWISRNQPPRPRARRPQPSAALLAADTGTVAVAQARTVSGSGCGADAGFGGLLEETVTLRSPTGDVLRLLYRWRQRGYEPGATSPTVTSRWKRVAPRKRTPACGTDQGEHSQEPGRRVSSRSTPFADDATLVVTKMTCSRSVAHPPRTAIG